MALLMSRPIKHPKTGIFWLRKRVPKDLLSLVGKGEVSRSLETRDPAEAKRRHSLALSEIEAQWANLRAGPRTLTNQEAYELAAVVHDRWLDMHRQDPGGQTFWRTDLFEKLWKLRWDPSDPLGVSADDVKLTMMENWCPGAGRRGYPRSWARAA